MDTFLDPKKWKRGVVLPDSLSSHITLVYVVSIYWTSYQLCGKPQLLNTLPK